MVTFRAPFSYWADSTFASLVARTFAELAEPSTLIELSADMVIAPEVDISPRQYHLITPQLVALANQFAYVMDLNYKMALLKKIEFATGQDLDIVWGRTYELKRRYGETDDKYRKRLQVYLLQIAGSGTKAAIEEIISIICEWPNSCRVDTYYPGYCRIYVTKDNARIKARERLDLINLVLPDTLAAGIDYRFYIPYVDLEASILLHGPVYNNLPASVALSGVVKTPLQASTIIASRDDIEIEASMQLAGIRKSPVRASELLQDRTSTEIEAGAALLSREDTELTASMPLQGSVETTFQAYERLYEDAHMPIDSDIALQANRLRPLEARMMLEA
jgi:hypothetical protein